MQIDEYLKSSGLTQAQFAERVGCTQGLVSQWINGETTVTVERAKAIEAATDGAVAKHELRPDVWEAPQGVAA